MSPQARIDAALDYDAAKATARFVKAKGAHDELVAAAHRAQADALEIEALAKRRLADEYDSAQARGEVQGHGRQGKRDVPAGNIPPARVTDLGLPRKQVHEARRLRDAENAEPGVIRKTLDDRLAQSAEPSAGGVRPCAGTHSFISALLPATMRKRTVTTADKPKPGADLQPIENPPAAPEQPEREAPSIPQDDDPEIEKTEEQPS